MDILKCRVCGHGEAESLGKIPDCGEFAGQQVSPPIKGGELWLCKDCRSMFRYPTLTPSDYIELYEKAPSTVWVEGGLERNDFATIYTCLKNHIGGSILDVGCYSGSFLEGLPDNFKKYGLEPSESASNCATSKGIDVLGKTLDELEPDRGFDVVVAIDVVEHVIDVEQFLGLALAHVKDNGLLIISTGNPECFVWKRVFKSRFWYNLFAEHVTFPSYAYFIEFARRHGLQTPVQIRFRYTKMKPLERLSRLLRFVYSFAVYKSLKLIRRFFTGQTTALSYVVNVSLTGVFTDHHVIIFGK